MTLSEFHALVAKLDFRMGQLAGQPVETVVEINPKAFAALAGMSELKTYIKTSIKYGDTIRVGLTTFVRAGSTLAAIA